MGAKHLATGQKVSELLASCWKTMIPQAATKLLSTNSHESKAKLKIAEYHE